MAGATVDIVGAHQSICKLHCKEMVNTVGVDLLKEVVSVTDIVIRGGWLAESRKETKSEELKRGG